MKNLEGIGEGCKENIRKAQQQYHGGNDEQKNDECLRWFFGYEFLGVLGFEDVSKLR
jgi:hypothetical protein